MQCIEAVDMAQRKPSLRATFHMSLVVVVARSASAELVDVFEKGREN